MGGGGTTGTGTGQIKAFMKALRQEIVPKVGQKATEFEGELTAPLTQGLQTLQKLLSSAGDNQFEGDVNSALSRGLSGKPSFDASPEELTKYFREGVEQPMWESFNREVIPRINESFAGLGSVFSSRQADAVRNAAEQQQSDLSGLLGRAQMDNFGMRANLSENAANRQLQTIPMTNYDLSRGSMFGQLGGMMQDYEQQGLDRLYQDFLRTTTESSPWTQMGMSAATGMSPMAPPGGGGSGMAGGLGSLLGAGLGVASMFFPPLAPVAAVAGPAMGALGGAAGGGQSPGGSRWGSLGGM